MPTYNPNTELVSRLLDAVTRLSIVIANIVAMAIIAFFLLFPNSAVHPYSLLPADSSLPLRLLAWLLNLIHVIHYSFLLGYIGLLFIVLALLYFCKILYFMLAVFCCSYAPILQVQRSHYFGENSAEALVPIGISRLLDYELLLQHWPTNITALN